MTPPLARRSLADRLAEQLRELIRSGGYGPGDRLPSIADLARRFGVGAPTVREALRRMEALGLVVIRHGSGVYAGRDPNALLISNPIWEGSVTSKQLLDLVEARIPIELQSAALAAENATAGNLQRMRELLERAEREEDDAELSRTNMAFHREVALASGNGVLHQLLEVLCSLFHEEQRAILDIYGSRERDHREHLGILEALERGDAALASERMRAHLDGVREALLRGGADGPGGGPRHGGA